jgi:hypothetical protein
LWEPNNGHLLPPPPRVDYIARVYPVPTGAVFTSHSWSTLDEMVEQVRTSLEAGCKVEVWPREKIR